MIDLTIVLAVDVRGLEQLSYTIPTWQLHRPEMFNMPWLVLYDPVQASRGLVSDFFRRFKPEEIRLQVWDPNVPYETQREKMLASFVCAAPRLVYTPYWAKIDTDAFATKKSDWTSEELLAGDPCYLASSWGYTKAKGGGGTTAEWAVKLEEFGDSFTNKPRLGLANHLDGRRITMSRMASWISIYSTPWTVWLKDVCERHCGRNRIPVPSQDTVAWYAAARTQVARVEKRKWAKRHGWGNIPNTEKLAARCKIVQCDEP